jgi:hypothetical protein
MSSDDPGYPPEIQAAVHELRRIRGVSNVDCDLCDLSAVRPQELGSIEFARYPITTLRRSGGGRPDEGMLQVTLDVTRDEDGWRAVEFLAWFVRDRARGGIEDEFRPFALPPVAGTNVQLGDTLRFVIEMFQVDASDGAPLKRMSDFASDLRKTIDLYDKMLRDRRDRGLA